MSSLKTASLKIATLIIIAVIIIAGIAVYVMISRPPAPTGITLRVISRHPYEILNEAREEFLQSEAADKYGITWVRWLPVDPGEWVDVIRTSAEKPGQEVDVAWGGGPTLFDFLAGEGLLAPLTSDAISAVEVEIPDEISGAPLKRVDEEGHLIWIAAAISSFGFTVNLGYLEDRGLPVPDEWTDLASEQYAITLPSPSVAVADSTKSTSNTRMYEIILQNYGWIDGWKIITLMGANSRVYDKSGLVRDAVIRGDVGAGITIDFYGYTAQLENPDLCMYVIPKDGSIVNGDPIALLSSSAHPEAAQAFIAWVLSAEGQKIWLDPLINRLPSNPKVFETPEGANRPDLKQAYEKTLQSMVIEFSDEVASSYEYAMMWFYHATIARAHDALQNAWSKLALAKLNGEITDEHFQELVNELTDPTMLSFDDPNIGPSTFTEEYAISISDLIRTDVNYRNEMVGLWIQAAEERYADVLQSLQALIGG